MGFLRWVRKATGHSDGLGPHLEALVEQEQGKMIDGYHYARWIVPLVATLIGGGVFLPLALLIHPLFWIGTGAFVTIGAVLGTIFHRGASKISAAQMVLRRRCRKLNQRAATTSLFGIGESLSPRVAIALDAAAKAYLSAVAPSPRATSDPERRAIMAIEQGMADLLSLAEPESPAAQEVLLNQAWAAEVLREMSETSAALEQMRSRSDWASLDDPRASLSGLREARSDLERLRAAAEELDRVSH